MKQGHLGIIFMLLYIFCFFSLYSEQKKYDRVQEEKQKVEHALLDAIENTGNAYRTVIYSSDEEKKKAVELAFLDTFHISMGLLDTTENRELWRMYLPMLALVEEDGAFFYYVEEVQGDKTTELIHRWTDKIEFCFSEDSTDAIKKASMANIMEKMASKIITNHNYIASQYGISYMYSVPNFFQDTSEKLELPTLFVVFQGWPLEASGMIFYENCIDAGVFLRQKEYYVVELPRSLSEPSCFYHLKSCPIVKKANRNLLDENVTMQEALQKYGAYPCNECIEQDEI